MSNAAHCTFHSEESCDHCHDYLYDAPFWRHFRQTNTCAKLAA